MWPESPLSPKTMIPDVASFGFPTSCGAQSSHHLPLLHRFRFHNIVVIDVQRDGQHLVHGTSVRSALVIAYLSSTALDSYVSELGNDISYEKRWVELDSC